MQIKIYGVSDDLVEIDGDVRDEFGAPDFIAFANGTLVQCDYGDDGVWHFEVRGPGKGATFSKTLGDADGDGDNGDGDGYSDVLTITFDAPVAWLATTNDDPREVEHRPIPTEPPNDRAALWSEILWPATESRREVKLNGVDL